MAQMVKNLSAVQETWVRSLGWEDPLEEGMATRSSIWAQTVKNLSAVQETWVRSLGWEDPLEKEMASHSSILAWEISFQRSLAGYSPWGCKESDMTERILLTSEY